MKLKHLQSALERVRVFDDPNIELEQYPTPPHLAAQIALAMHQHGDVEGKAIGGKLSWIPCASPSNPSTPARCAQLNAVRRIC